MCSKRTKFHWRRSPVRCLTVIFFNGQIDGPHLQYSKTSNGQVQDRRLAPGGNLTGSGLLSGAQPLISSTARRMAFTWNIWITVTARLMALTCNIQKQVTVRHSTGDLRQDDGVHLKQVFVKPNYYGQLGSSNFDGILNVFKASEI